MKKSMICFLVVSGLVISSVMAFAQTQNKVALRDLPESVRKTVKAQQGDNKIARIEKETRDGQTVYQVIIDRPGKNKIVWVAENGSLVTGAAGAEKAAASLRLNELPKPVRQTFKREAGSAKISDIDKNIENGRTVYEIEFTRAGKMDELFIHEDGTIAQATVSQENSDSTASAPSSNANRFDRPLAATKKVNFNDVPEAVKQTAFAQAGSNRIEDAEQGTLDGRVIYEIAFKKDGQHNEVRIDKNGSIVQRIGGTNIRFPGALSVDEVPGPVRRAIRDQVGSGEVNDIDKLTVDGKTVYEVGYKKQKGGAQQEIQIAEDGTVIDEPAGARK